MRDDLFSEPFEEDPQAGREAEEIRPAERRVYTVSELTAAIRGTLETRFGEIWVDGELSNCRIWNTGHIYFTLKDRGAQIKAVMFRSAVRYLRFDVGDGLHVLARGRLGVYDPKGEYQLACEYMEPRGLGARQAAFEQLKKRLQADGLFDPARKRSLPALPRRIGIVTSLDGAAIRDIIKVLRRRHPNAHLIIRPTRVQGDGASHEIVRGLRAIARVPGVDVIILGRGGGSVEDLWAFNDEAVARTIAASRVPVISAVGHETDFTIADFVADVRAPTPSAAAEMVVAAKTEFSARIDRLTDRLHGGVRAELQRQRSLVHALTSRRGFAGWPARLAMRGRHTADMAHELRRAMATRLARMSRDHRTRHARLESREVRRRVAAMRARLSSGHARLGASAVRERDRAGSRVAALVGRLESLSPLAVLSRGYAVCWNAERSAIVSDAAGVAAGDHVRVTLHRGELECEVIGRDDGPDH